MPTKEFANSKDSMDEKIWFIINADNLTNYGKDAILETLI